MPFPPVIVEIQAEQATPELVETLLGACSRAVAVTPCVVAGSQQDPEQPTAVAIVTWIGPRTVRIQVGLREDRRWREQQVSFTSADAEDEVWKAVGFSTGTLVARESQLDKPSERPIAQDGNPRRAPPAMAPPRPARPPTAKPLLPPPAPKPTRQREAWTAFDWAVNAGNGLDYRDGTSGWRYGGFIRGTYFRRGGWLATLSLGEAMGSAKSALGLGSWWTTVGLGGGVAARFRTLGLELRAEAIAERTTLIRVQGGAHETRSGWTTGGRIGFDLVWMPTRLLGLVAGTSLRGTGRDSAVGYARDVVGGVPAWVFGVGAGVRFELR